MKDANRHVSFLTFLERKASVLHTSERSFSTHVVTGTIPFGGLTSFEFATQIKFISNPSNKKQLFSCCSEGT